MNATPEILWALLCTSPERARWQHVEPVESHPALPPGGEVLELELERDGVPLRACVYILGREAAYHVVRTDDASPAAFRDELVARGIHLRAAMVRDILWRARNHPISAFVVIAAEKHDHALYVLGDVLEDDGKVQYERSLVKCREAERDGWPGWRARSVQVLE